MKLSNPLLSNWAIKCASLKWYFFCLGSLCFLCCMCFSGKLICEGWGGGHLQGEKIHPVPGTGGASYISLIISHSIFIVHSTSARCRVNSHLTGKETEAKWWAALRLHWQASKPFFWPLSQSLFTLPLCFAFPPLELLFSMLSALISSCSPDVIF